MKKLFIYYNFIIVSILTFGGFLGAHSTPQILSAALFYPLAMYFMFLVIPHRAHALVLPEVVNPKKKSKKTKPQELTKIPEDTDAKFDLDRRAFLKLIGGAGLSIFMLSLFTKRAHGAFFGSVPGPGTVALKDTSGIQIDPAQHHPTDGYRISELDDVAFPSYFGFVNASGNWYFIRENPSGTFRYENGGTDTDFTTAWAARAAKTYGLFGDEF